jgi:hypothetical protein
MISAPSRFFYLWQVYAGSDKQGFQSRLLKQAQAFLEETLLADLPSRGDLDRSSSQAQNLQGRLLQVFYERKPTVDSIGAAQAGLCLRCYISEPILKACQKIDSLFHAQGCFTYQDLLPFVLNDDGKALIVLDDEGKTQLNLDSAGNTRSSTYPVFSIKILQTFRPNLESGMSLDNWSYLQTRQNPDIKKFLSEFGFQQVSDWALLNRVRSTQLERLSGRDRHLIESFHAVYRRDRRQQQKFSIKCLSPSLGQLQEMIDLLRSQAISYTEAERLLIDLKQVASQLRQYDIWCNREPLDAYDPVTQTHTFRSDLPYEAGSSKDPEQQELLDFLSQQFTIGLNQAIETCLRGRVATLAKSRRYRLFSDALIPGLLLYYQQGKSLREIAFQQGMSSWDQARRILNPGELLSQVRLRTVEYCLQQILAKAQQMGFAQHPPAPDYLKNLMEQVEAFADREVFQKAAEELHAGKNRLLNSVYAQHLVLMLEKQTQPIATKKTKKEYHHA